MAEHCAGPSTSRAEPDESLPSQDGAEVPPPNPESPEDTRNLSPEAKKIITEFKIHVNNLLSQIFAQSEVLYGKKKPQNEESKLTLKKMTDFAIKVNDQLQGLYKIVLETLYTLLRSSMRQASTGAMAGIKCIITNTKSQKQTKTPDIKDSSLLESEVDATVENFVNLLKEIMTPTKQLFLLTADAVLRRVALGIILYMRSVEDTVKSCIEERKSKTNSAIVQVNEMFEFACKNQRSSEGNASTQETPPAILSSLKSTKTAMEEISTQMDENVGKALDYVHEIDQSYQSKIVEMYKCTFMNFRFAALGHLAKFEEIARDSVREINTSISDVKRDLELNKDFNSKHLENLMSASMRYIISLTEQQTDEATSIFESLIEKIDIALESSLTNAEDLIHRAMEDMEEGIKSSQKLMDTAIEILNSQLNESSKYFPVQATPPVQSEQPDIFVEVKLTAEQNIPQLDPSEIGNGTMDEEIKLLGEKPTYTIKLCNILKERLKKSGGL